MQDTSELQRLKRAHTRNATNQWKALGKRPYRRLPADHPDFDAEDLPRWWQRFGAELAGACVLIAVLAAVMFAVQPLYEADPLNKFLAWLTGRLP